MSNQVMPSASESRKSSKSSSSSSSSSSEESERRVESVSQQLLDEMIPKGGFSPVDVTPKMHVSEFSMGNFLEEVESKQLPPVKTQETPFIPLQLALDYVKKMEGDMKGMHDHHKDLLKQLDKCYSEIEQETQGRYKAFIAKWKSQQDDRYGSLRAAYEQEKQNNKELKAWSQSSIQDLQAKIRDLSQGKNMLLQDINSQMAGVEEQSHSVIKAVEKDYAVQLVAVKEQASEIHTYEVCQLVIDMMINHIEAEQNAFQPVPAPVLLTDPEELSELKEHIEKLQLENIQLAQQVQFAPEANKEKFDEEIEALNEKLKLKKNKYKAKTQALEDENKDVKEQLKNLQQSLTVSKEGEDPEITAIRTQLANMDTEVAEKREQVNNLEKENSELKGAMVIYKTKDDKIVKQKEKIAKLREENKKFSAKIQIAKNKLKKADEEGKEQERKIKLANESLKKTNDKLKDLKSEAQLYKDKYFDKKEKAKDRKEEIKDLRAKLDGFAAVPAAMLVASADDDEEKTALRQQLAQSEAMVKTLQQDIEKAPKVDESEAKNLKQELRKAQDEVSELKDQIAELQQRPPQVIQQVVPPPEIQPSEIQQVNPPPEIQQRPTEPPQLVYEKPIEATSSMSEKPAESNSIPAVVPVPVPLSQKDDVDVESMKHEIQALKNHIEQLTDDNDKLKLLAVPAESDETKQQLAETLEALQATRKELDERPQQQTVDNMQQRINELEEQINASQSSNDEQIFILKKQLQDRETEYEERLKSAETSHSTALRDKEAEINQAKQEKDQTAQEKSQLQQQVSQMQQQQATMTSEMEQLRKEAGEAESLGRQVATLTTNLTKMQESNALKEQELKNSIRQRKLLHNQLEDLKGKIRVFCRVRPMNQSELQRNCENITSIVDEFTINCETKNNQIKPFIYDSVFGPNSTQEEVFEDTRRLVQSAVDGYNVCIFAYGQTGSGKTFTIQGVPGNVGVTPRAIQELFDILGSLPGHYSYSVTCYMVELYLDNLVDLFLPKEMRGNPPPLNIKKDPKGMVVIPEAYQHSVNTPEELMARFDQGNTMRHTSSTKMNDSSSRSHLIFGVLIDVTNRETQQRTVGKLSLVDLAGSERVSKTEATPERLKEGRAINKSLTALGDVISALSSGESHVPYRNNKLTMLMSDSLGGTAKTLMFVNISPASYNREETLMSLFYAARVKLITNEPAKNVETKEMSKMKREIVQLQVERDKYLAALEKSGISLEKVQEILSSPEKADFDDPIYDEL